jgi:hypothetical protein
MITKLMKSMNGLQKASLIGFAVLFSAFLIQQNIVSLKGISLDLAIMITLLYSSYFCVVIFTQSRSLERGLGAVVGLSIVGILLACLGWLYICGLMWFAAIDANSLVKTNSSIFNLSSILVATSIALGVLFMFTAYLFSFKPSRFAWLQYVTWLCGFIATVLNIFIHSREATVVGKGFIIAAVIGTLFVMFFSRRASTKNRLG